MLCCNLQAPRQTKVLPLLIFRKLRDRVAGKRADAGITAALNAMYAHLPPTIVSLRRTEAGEFVMLDYGVRYSMDNGHHRA